MSRHIPLTAAEEKIEIRCVPEVNCDRTYWYVVDGHIEPDVFIRVLDWAYAETCDLKDVVHTYQRCWHSNENEYGDTVCDFGYPKGRGAKPVTYVLVDNVRDNWNEEDANA